MNEVLFKQSEVNDPYALYARQLATHPVCWDAADQVWGIYGYDDCRSLLNSADAYIPAIPANERLNEYAATLLRHLVRLSNGEQHAEVRAVVVQLHSLMQPVPVAATLDVLLVKHIKDGICDWVAVSKELPVYHLLQCFGFAQETITAILPFMEQLVKVMWPHKTAEDIIVINETAEKVYRLTEQHLLTGAMGLVSADRLVMSTVNLVGLMIQSYDAGRGILCNALLQVLKNGIPHNNVQFDELKRLVVETLRYDPPIQHTRRMLMADTVVSNNKLSKGDTVIIMLASANRDTRQFERPEFFDVTRSNNDTHLTLGLGAHACVAQHSAVNMTTEALVHLFSKHPRVRLQISNISYEPLLNARLPQSMLIDINDPPETRIQDLLIQRQ
jgi:cytochrome P450